ncbi:MAG: hypothetical protein ACHQUC_04795 [Chlamydiales bacterium]
MMSTISSSVSFLQGWGHARLLAAGKAYEDSVRQGCNRILLGLAQFDQLDGLSYLIEKMMNANKLPFWSCVSIPLALGTLDYLTNKYTIYLSPLLKSSVKWLNSQIGSLCQIASVASCIGLLVLGHKVYALTSLTVLTMGYLERYHLLPQRVREVYLRVSPWIVAASTIVVDSWFYRILNWIDLTGQLVHLFSSKSSIPYEQTVECSHLNFEQLKQVMKGEAKITDNRDHVLIMPFPVAQDINCQPLLDLCHSFPWDDEKIFADLNTTLMKDARWQQSPEYAQCISDPLRIKEIKIAYAKNKVATSIYGISQRNIGTDQPLNYTILKNYLGYIAHHLPSAPKDLQRQILIQLAVEGGDYCGSGVNNQYESASYLLMNHVQALNPENSQSKRMPLKQRVLTILQQERLKIFQCFHALTEKINPLLLYLDGGIEDVHAFNSTVNRLALDFGLPNQRPRDSSAARSSIIEKYLYRFLLGFSSEELWTGTTFKNEEYLGYSKRIVNAILDEIGTPMISRVDIFEWATSWIKKQKISQQEKDQFLEDLVSETVFSNYLKFHPEFIQAMLIDMGILSIVV